MKFPRSVVSFSITRESDLVVAFEAALGKLQARRSLPFFRGQFLADLKMVFVEGSANAIRHAGELKNRKKIDVVVALTGTAVEIRIDDHGKGFSIDRWLRVLPSRHKTSGRGLFLMRQLMDEVHYRRERRKNTLVLKRAIPGLSAGEATLDLLHEISEALARNAEPSAIYRLILDRAIEVFDVEKASLLLFDTGSRRLRVVASRGLSAPLARKIAVRPGEGIAGYVFQHAKPCLIEDMHRNRAGWKRRGRYKSRSFISAPMISSPLKVGEDPVGVINVTDRKNGRPFTRADLRLLSTMANQASACLQLSKLLGRAKEGEALRREMEIASEIQRGYLPLHPPGIAGLDMAGTCETAQAVGGDYFDCLRQDNHIYLVIADVSGHNIAAALTMVGFRSHLKALLSSEIDPGKILTRLNRGLFDDLARQEQFVSTCLVRFSSDGRTGQIAVAGHRVPLLCRQGEVSPVVDQEKSGGVLGVDPAEVFSSIPFSIDAGDSLFFYTDGVIEMTNGRGNRLGFEGFVRILSAEVSEEGETANATVRRIMKSLDRFREGSIPTDDRTLMVVRVT